MSPKSTSGHGVTSWPADFGNEGAGVVETVGAEVQVFKEGDEVLARFEPCVPNSAAFQVNSLHCPKQDSVRQLVNNTLQEYSIITHTQVPPKPTSLSYEEAASIPFALLSVSTSSDMI